MPLQWQEHPPLTTEPQTDELDIFAPDYPARRLVQLLEQMANDAEAGMSKSKYSWKHDFHQGRADAFRLAAEWIRKDLIRDTSE